MTDKGPGDLARASAVEFVELYRGGKASPVEATTEILAWIDAKGATLNCFCLIDSQAALAAAAASQDRWGAVRRRAPSMASRRP